MKKKYIIILLILVIFVPINAYAACPLGADVTKDLSGALRIMKIAGPILVLVMTLWEGVKGLAKGDAEENTKKFFNRFARRLLAAALLFVIPVIVDVLMQIMNVWDADGGCVLESPASGASAPALNTSNNNVNAGKIDPTSQNNNVNAVSIDVTSTKNNANASNLNTEKKATANTKENTNSVNASTNTRTKEIVIGRN